MKDCYKENKELVASSVWPSMLYISLRILFSFNLRNNWFFKYSSQLSFSLDTPWLYAWHLPFSFSITPSSLFQALIFTSKLNSEDIEFLFHVQSYNFALLFQANFFFFNPLQQSHLEILVRIKGRPLEFFINLYNSLVHHAKELLSTSGHLTSMQSSERSHLSKIYDFQETWKNLLVRIFLF